jgi:hypothetical protein
LNHPPYHLSCLCGTVRVEVHAQLAEVGKCNCSLCVSSGFLHWKVPKRAVHIAAGADDLSTYTWPQAIAINHFCRKCGVAMFRTDSADTEISANARCIEGVNVTELKIVTVRGEEALH